MRHLNWYAKHMRYLAFALAVLATAVGHTAPASAQLTLLQMAPATQAPNYWYAATEKARLMCRLLAVTDASYRTTADFWAEAGVARATIYDLLDSVETLQNLACSLTIHGAQWDAANTALRQAQNTLVAQYGVANGIPSARRLRAVEEATAAAVLRAAQLCGGGANPSKIYDFVAGRSTTSIDLFGRPAGGNNLEVVGLVAEGSDYYTGLSIPCVKPIGANPGASGGSAGTSNDAYHNWKWGQPFGNPGVGSCFDSIAGGNSCSPYASAPDLGREQTQDLTVDNTLAALGLSAAGATAVIALAEVTVCVALCAAGVVVGVAALAVAAATAVWNSEKAIRDMSRELGYLCPATVGSTPLVISSPTGIGPLSTADVLGACKAKCNSSTLQSCSDINDRLSCNYNPIAANGFPIDECVEVIHESNPWVDEAKIQAEICGRMTCPPNAYNSVAPSGQCTCSSSIAGSVFVNFGCFRVLCSPFGDCTWGC